MRVRVILSSEVTANDRWRGPVNRSECDFRSRNNDAVYDYWPNNRGQNIMTDTTLGILITHWVRDFRKDQETYAKKDPFSVRHNRMCDKKT